MYDLHHEAAPERSWHTTTRTLRIAAFILHSVLVATYFVLLVIWARAIENRITVALEYQKVVSYLITTTTTTFGNVRPSIGCGWTV